MRISDWSSDVCSSDLFREYLNPERDVPPEAERIHGLSAEFLKDKPLFKAIAPAFLDFVADAPLIIHNAAFDMKFLNAELSACGLGAQIGSASCRERVCQYV